MPEQLAAKRNPVGEFAAEHGGAVGTRAYASEADVSARLQAVEEERDLLRHTLDGWCVWPLLRFTVARALQNLPQDRAAREFRRSELLPVMVRDLRCLAAGGRAKVVVKTYSSAHVDIEDGHRKDIYFDDLLKAFDDYFKIESLNSHAVFSDATPYVKPRHITTVVPNILASKLGRLLPPRRCDALASQLAEDLRDGFGLGHFTPDSLAPMLADFHWSRTVYRHILKSVTPRCVLLADTGDYPITAAARELGVPVVEFQHGFTHRHFPGNSWSRYARAYKQNMPLPSRIFVYGSHWRRELAANGFWDDELRVVGSTRVDSYRSHPRPPRGETCVLLATAQATDTARLIAFLGRFTQLADSCLRYHLYVKMHPAYPTNQEAFMVALGRHPNVELIPGGGPPSTFELLGRTHLHLSVYSTCHYEALALGVPTAIIALTGSENVYHLYESRQAFLAETPEDLLGVVRGWRELHVPDAAGAEYFAPDAVDNMVRELESLGCP